MKALKTLFHDSQDFVKLSDLAGKRWPNVTEDDIFHWHDGAYFSYCDGSGKFIDAIKELWPDKDIHEGVVIDIEKCWGEAAPLDCIVTVIKELWPQKELSDSVINTVNECWEKHYPSASMVKAIHTVMGEIGTGAQADNLFEFWVFFAEFRSLQTGRDMSSASDLEKKIHELAPFDLIINSFFQPDPETTKRFAYNKDGKINCIQFWDEKGKCHFPAVQFEGSHKFQGGQIEVKKEDLYLKESSIRFIEKIAPEITTTSFHDIKNSTEASSSANKMQEPLLSTDEKPLNGLDNIANFLGVSVSTVKIWKKRKSFPIHRIGRRYYAFPSEINHMIKNK